LHLHAFPTRRSSDLYKRSAINVAFDCPCVVANAGSCLFLLLGSTTSPSIMVISPTPPLHKNSAANEPTPPKPSTITWLLINLFKFSLPIRTSVLDNQAVSCMYFIY